MKYLVTYSQNGILMSLYTDHFNPETDFVHFTDMAVYDLVNHKVIVNSLGWSDIDKSFINVSQQNITSHFSYLRKKVDQN